MHFDFIKMADNIRPLSLNHAAHLPVISGYSQPDISPENIFQSIIIRFPLLVRQ